MKLENLKTSEEIKKITINELKTIVKKDKPIKYERIGTLKGKLYDFSNEGIYTIEYDSIDEMLYVETCLKCKMDYSIQMNIPKHGKKVIEVSEDMYAKFIQNKRGRMSFNDVVVDLMFRNQFETE